MAARAMKITHAAPLGAHHHQQICLALSMLLVLYVSLDKASLVGHSTRHVRLATGFSPFCGFASTRASHLSHRNYLAQPVDSFNLQHFSQSNHVPWSTV